MALTCQAFSLTSHDAALSARTTAADWARILVLRDHPDFLKALFAYEALMPAYFAENIILNKVVTEAWRFEMLVYTLYLDDIRDPDDPRSGLTISNLTRICRQQNCASRGRVLTILGIMTLGGYLRRETATGDARVARLVPSPAFLSIVEGWNHRIFQIIDAVMPEGDLARHHEQRPRFGRDMRRRGAETLLAGWKLLDPFPEVAHFVSRDGGWMLLLTCVADSLRASEGREIAPVSIELKRFGARFGVSRSHLRRLLESAYAAGLLDEPPQNGSRIVPSPLLVASFLGCMASELAHYRLWAHDGLTSGATVTGIR